MAEIHALSHAHLPIGKPVPEITSLLRSLLVKAKRGDVTGLCVAWVEGCENETNYQVEAGHARGALLVAAVSGLFWEVNRLWRGA